MKYIYRAKNSLRIFISIFVAFSLLCSIGFWRGLTNGTHTWLELSVGILLLCVGAGAAVEIFTAKVVITEDFIRSGSVFREKILPWSKIRFRREYEEFQENADGGVNVSYLELIPRGDLPALKIPKDDFDFDQAFWGKILRIPEMD